MARNRETTNGTLRSLGTAMAGLVAVVTLMYAMVEPLRQRIEFLNQEVQITRASIKEHEEIVGHPGVLERLAETMERFREVSTQLGDLERRIASYEEWQLWWQRILPSTNSRQDEKIYRLETRVYGHAQKYDDEQLRRDWLPPDAKIKSTPLGSQ
jgi:hypothetical protein